MIKKKDLTAICAALRDGFSATEVTLQRAEEVSLVGATREADEEFFQKERIKRLHIYHDTARDIGKVLAPHNKTFDEERFIRNCMPKMGVVK